MKYEKIIIFFVLYIKSNLEMKVYIYLTKNIKKTKINNFVTKNKII